jgi:predicted transcriptional regulator YheO
MNESHVFDIIKVVGSALTQTFGENVEVLLHDTADPQRSIIWIEGDVTGRQVGGPMTNLGLSALQDPDGAKDLINYSARASDGRLMKSSTIFLRNEENQVFGIFCFNVDLSRYAELQGLLSDLLTPGRDLPVPKSFAPDLNKVLDTIIDHELEESNVNGSLSRDERMNIVARLEKRGFFRIRKAVSVLAERLQVSRFTLYNDLKHVRGED